MKLKNIILISLLVVVMAGLSIYGYFNAISGVDEAEDYPVVSISPNNYDFGEVEYGEIKEYVFKLKNIGSSALEIKKVATSCGCTTAEVGKLIIEPGEIIDLSVRYDTGAMSGPHGMGAQERIIYVKSNDPVNPQIEVTINAIVK